MMTDSFRPRRRLGGIADSIADEIGKAPETKKVIALYPGRTVVRGTPSGKEYVFEINGTIQDVDIRDYDYLLSLQRGEVGCCGTPGQGETRYFAPVE
jgi:hypothetical protein